MKKQIKNTLIIILIIAGIVSVWFVKNKANVAKIVEENNVGDDALDILLEDEIGTEEDTVGDGTLDILLEDEIGTEEDTVGDGALDIPLEDEIGTEEDTVGDGVLDIPLENGIETEGNSIGDVALDIPLVKIDKNDPNFELSTPSFDIETLKTYGLPILLDFGAKWCGPCRKMHPILEELNNELKGKAIIKYVDIDNYPEATKGFNFTLIPTQYFINKDGEVYKTHTGIISKDEAISILKEMGMEE